MKTKRVYVSGTITGDPDWRDKHLKACRLLEQLGFEPVSPAMDEYRLADDAPEGDDDPLNQWREWMRYDLQLLWRCDAFTLLPGWARSKGSIVEWLIADRFLGLERVWLDELYEKEPNQ